VYVRGSLLGDCAIMMGGCAVLYAAWSESFRSDNEQAVSLAKKKAN
jgi:hypothetical protein